MSIKLYLLLILIQDDVRQNLQNVYLYAEKPKIKLGRELKGKVWRTTRTKSGLVIKSNSNWPESHWRYDAILDDMSQIKAGDEVTFKITDLDKDNKLFIGLSRFAAAAFSILHKWPTIMLPKIQTTKRDIKMC